MSARCIPWVDDMLRHTWCTVCSEESGARLSWLPIDPIGPMRRNGTDRFELGREVRQGRRSVALRGFQVSPAGRRLHEVHEEIAAASQGPRERLGRGHRIWNVFQDFGADDERHLTPLERTGRRQDITPEARAESRSTPLGK